MRETIGRGADVLRREGPLELVRRTATLGRRTISNAYWNRKGVQAFDVGGTVARFAVPGSGDGGIRWMVRHERSFLDDVLAELRPSDVFYDVGANVGLFTCFGQTRLTEGRVYAFEPLPSNVTRLLENVRLNANGATVTAFPMAVSDSAGSIGFEVETDEVGFQVASVVGANAESGLRVQTRTIDDLVDRGDVRPPDVVKIDVEGAEMLVLEGMDETLDRCRVVFCEVHLPSDHRPSLEDAGSSFDEVRTTLESKGFDVHVVASRDDDVQIRATR